MYELLFVLDDITSQPKCVCALPMYFKEVAPKCRIASNVKPYYDILDLCLTWPAVTLPTLLELCLAWPAVTLPTLLELWRNGYKVQSAPTTTVRCISSWHGYSCIQQSTRSVKSMNDNNTKTSKCENTDANINCDFCDGDNIRSMSRLPHTHDHALGHTHG